MDVSAFTVIKVCIRDSAARYRDDFFPSRSFIGSWRTCLHHNQKYCMSSVVFNHIYVLSCRGDSYWQAARESCCCCGVVVTGAGRSCRLHGRVWSRSGNWPGSESFKGVCKTLNELCFDKPLQAADGYWEEEEEKGC